MRDRRRAAKKKAVRKGVEMAEKRRAYGVTPVYDDGRRYNGYQCSPQGGCGGIWLTVDLDKGTTPMFTRCLATKGCPGMAVSLGYPRALPPRKLPLLVEWYEPAEDVVLPENLAEHVRKGGLLRRMGPDAPGWILEMNMLGPKFPRKGETNTQLELIQEDDNGTAQESSDHVHHAGSPGGSGAGADPGPAGEGEALEEVRGPEQDPRQ